jgi:dUTPase
MPTLHSYRSRTAHTLQKKSLRTSCPLANPRSQGTRCFNPSGTVNVSYRGKRRDVLQVETLIINRGAQMIAQLVDISPEYDVQ